MTFYAESTQFAGNVVSELIYEHTSALLSLGRFGTMSVQKTCFHELPDLCYACRLLQTGRIAYLFDGERLFQGTCQYEDVCFINFNIGLVMKIALQILKIAKGLFSMHLARSLCNTKSSHWLPIRILSSLSGGIIMRTNPWVPEDSR